MKNLGCATACIFMDSDGLFVVKLLLSDDISVHLKITAVLNL